MNKKDESAEIQKKVMELMVPFEKFPTGLKESTFEFIEFRRELTKESDRGCALLAAAHLDFMLETLLRKKLIGNKKHFDLLFGFTGPVGTFSSRILLSYSMGLISPDDLNDIQIIRKIRNDFGHKPTIIGFDDHNIKDQCNNLKLNVYGKDATPRQQFLNSVSSLSGQLEGSIRKEKRFDEHQNIDLAERKKHFEQIMELFKKVINEVDNN